MSSLLSKLVCVLFVSLLGACQSFSHRPVTIGHEPCTRAERAASAITRETPEILSDGKTLLHFVEFDDQGWLYPDHDDDGAPVEGTPGSQIDCAIKSLSQSLGKQPAEKVSLFVYVHGWHHGATAGDSDLDKFKDILLKQGGSDRQIVGIYVGWQGESIDVPGLSMLTFWGRKNAAEHIAAGRVRELFSRIRGLRAFWNGRRLNDIAASPTDICAYKPGTQLEPGADPCPLRTILIGHSFGGLILYESAQPYLMETLTVYRDIDEPLRPRNESPASARARGLADMIILLNPAFEGSRYEPIHQANAKYHGDGKEPPLMVSLTSSADWATGTAFPVIRTINTILQYPANSEDESSAMKRTPGHIERFITHKLCTNETDCDPHWNPIPMRLCNSLTLFSKTMEKSPIVWNVTTNGKVMDGHNDITNDRVLSFVGQMYAKIIGVPDEACPGTPPAVASAKSAP